MANWQTPKTDYNSLYIPGPGDFNRIEGNEVHLKQNAKTMSVITGTINHGGTIPLPPGYSESQCKWFVSPYRLGFQGATDQMECFTSGRTVVCRTRYWDAHGGSYDPTAVYVGGVANYMVIGIKGV